MIDHIETAIGIIMEELPSGWSLEVKPLRGFSDPPEFNMMIRDNDETQVAIVSTLDDAVNVDPKGGYSHTPEQAFVNAMKVACAKALLVHKKRLLTEYVGIYTSK